MQRSALLAPLVALALSPLGTGCQPTTQGGDDKDMHAPVVDLRSPPDLTAPTCGTAEYKAQQDPAALLVLLDRSSSMAQNGKWTSASQAIIQTLDQDIFDSMSVGLLAAPSGSEAGPACLAGFPVSCLAPTSPQIPLQLAGAQKSTGASGVRHDIQSWFNSNGPDNGLGDATPLYDAINTSINSLKAWPQTGKRILFVVTDGTIDCTQYSNRSGYPDCNGCTHDWEDPTNIITLLKNANTDATHPIESFVVGLPGADTTGQMCPLVDNPPYHMRLALSAMAFAGSPSYVPATCTGKSFTKAGGDPTVSCHFDMTQGNFSAMALAGAISMIRGKVLGCVFDLPQPGDGGLIDQSKVNVSYTAGGVMHGLYRRKDPNNMCTMDGCWDYTNDGKVQLFGKACDDVKGAANVDVKISVGCLTVFG